MRWTILHKRIAHYDQIFFVEQDIWPSLTSNIYETSLSKWKSYDILEMNNQAARFNTKIIILDFEKKKKQHEIQRMLACWRCTKSTLTRIRTMTIQRVKNVRTQRCGQKHTNFLSAFHVQSILDFSISTAAAPQSPVISCYMSRLSLLSTEGLDTD